MKFNCVTSNTTLGGHKALFGLLREQNDGKNHHIFIVPDRYTLGVERAICEELYPDGTFNIDVCTFTRLAQKALGNKNKECLSKEGTVLLLNRIINEKNDELGYYKNVKSVAFSREMFASIASLRSSNISVEDINDRIAEIDGVTKEKLKDIAVIYKAYNKALLGKYYDTITRVDWLKNNLDSVEFVKNSHIYVLGFNVYSMQQFSLIQKLLLECPSVSISFCTDSGGSNKACFPTRQYQQLLEFCQNIGINTVRYDSTEVLHPPFNALHREMFGFVREQLNTENVEKVRICAAKNMYAEIKDVAKEIAHLVFSKDYRYRDIAVVNGNAEYVPIIKTIFERCGIPYFIDEKYYVKNSFFARYVMGLFDAVESNFDRCTIFSLTKNPCFGFSREEIQIFENYCLKYNINYSALEKQFLCEDKGVDAELSVMAEKVRKTVFDAVFKIKPIAKISEYCDIINVLVKNENISEISEKYADCKETALKVYAKTEKFLNMINEINALCGDRESDVTEFSEMVRAIMENMTESVLPQYMDSVFVGDVADSRFSSVKAMFVIGANEGNFPKTAGDKLVLGYYDTEMMKRNGLEVYPTPLEHNAFEQFAVIDLISKPENLYVTYCSCGVGGEKLYESSGVRELKFRLGIKEKRFFEYYGFSDSEKLLYNAVTPQNCYYEYMSGNIPLEYRKSTEDYLVMKGLLRASETSSAEYNLLDGYAKNDNGEYKISVSKMETYFACPFKNYLTNVLKLKEREEGGLRVANKGVIIHAILEDYFNNDKELLRTATRDELDKLISKSIDKVLYNKENSRFYEDEIGASDMDNIRRECVLTLNELTESLRHSKFNPQYTEKRFGDNGELSLEVDGKKFIFTGYIDRVDVDENNRIVIIDYKTGKVDDGLGTVYSGEKIQLYLYLKYFLDKNCSVAGVFYLPLSDSYKKGGTSYAMKGQMLNSIETFESFDDRVLDTHDEIFRSRNVAFGVENKGEQKVFARANSGNLLFKEDFKNISDYVLRICEVALVDIMDGDIEKKPMKGKCDYCAYRKICGEVAERSRVSAAAKDFTPITITEKENEVE